ncbi:cilia- and flagella-associated protein 45-like, partial [Corapipo altera]|uniref:cilia- and flagella-associated protein 45-like n=1 Tax=Corapipo altera TaxID=415028 RepID=UPI000FD67CDD
MLRERPKSPGAAAAGGYKPKTTRLFSKDLIRDLVIPEEKPPGSLILSRKDLELLKEEAEGLSREELGHRGTALQAKQDAAIDALIRARSAERRKAELQERLEQRPELEEERRERERELLERAGRMRMEQEEEMRELNSILLNAKCHMIRDRQVLEKRLIRRELAEEEKRLEKLMETEREKGLWIQEELERRRKEQLDRMKREVLEQLEQRDGTGMGLRWIRDGSRGKVPTLEFPGQSR